MIFICEQDSLETALSELEMFSEVLIQSSAPLSVETLNRIGLHLSDISKQITEAVGSSDISRAV